MSILQDTMNVSDPTDFPKETKSLRALDSSFRCSICLEIFDAPMSLPCGHSFCSLCIRQNILTRNECAQCRKPTNEFNLAKNAQLEEAALSWKVARPALLELIAQLEAAKAEAERLRVRREKGKGKASPVQDTEDAEATSRPTKRRRTRSLASDDDPAVRARASSTKIEPEEEEEEELAHGAGDCIPSSDAEEQAIEDDRVVSCPMGAHKTYMEHINAHIDSGCKLHTYKPGHGSGATRRRPSPASPKKTKLATKSAWKDVFQSSSRSSNREGGRGKDSHSPSAPSPSERLPKVSYSVLKDKKIRELLQEHHLAITGSRDQQIARHQYFVTLYNANLDRPYKERKTTDELRRELRKWEESLTVKKIEVSDPKAYLKKNSDHFKAQIRALRERKNQSGNLTSGDGRHGVSSLAGPPSRSLHLGRRSEQPDIVSDSDGDDILVVR